ncbi:MAG: DUF423 domain-containing protein [Bacteroidota bacterium]
MSRTFFVAASTLGFLGVAAGAFGAHALRDSLTVETQGIFETAVRYQMYHVFAIAVAGWAVDRFVERKFLYAGWFFVAGIVIFSGSLYVLTLTGLRWLGAITPIGGASLLAGWYFLARGFWNLR